MTIEEFNQTGFGMGMEVEYNGEKCNIVSVDFEEALIGIHETNCGSGDDEISWKRCENCKLI